MGFAMVFYLSLESLRSQMMLAYRDVARSFSTLSQTESIRLEMIKVQSLTAVLMLAKSLDIGCQRYSALTLCNLCSGDSKVRIAEEGAIRPLIFLCRFPDTE